MRAKPAGAPRELLIAGALACVVSSCFAPHEVEPSGTELVWAQTRTLDDAERADGFPNWSLFSPWDCQGWGGGASSVRCGTIEPGVDDAGHARSFTFDVGPGSATDYTSAGLLSYAVVELDLSGYHQLVFSAALEPSAEQVWPDDVELRFQLNCPGLAIGAAAAADEPPSVQIAIVPAPDGAWRTFVLKLADFIQPSWQTSQRIDPMECVQRVASLGFVVAANQPGERLAGSLSVDAVGFDKVSGAHGRPQADVILSPWTCSTLDRAADCEATGQDPIVTQAPGPNGGASTGQALCAFLDSVSEAMELVPGELDMTRFSDVAVAATFEPAGPSGPPGRFSMRLFCDSPNQLASVARSFDAPPGLSTYQFPISSFARDSLQGDASCLSHVDGVCFETATTSDDAVLGALSVHEVVLR